MARRKREPIKVYAYVTVGDREVSVDDLTEKQKAKLAHGCA